MYAYHPDLLQAVVQERRHELERFAGQSRLRRGPRHPRRRRRS
jgi:hypothetical protein